MIVTRSRKSLSTRAAHMPPTLPPITSALVVGMASPFTESTGSGDATTPASTWTARTAVELHLIDTGDQPGVQQHPSLPEHAEPLRLDPQRGVELAAEVFQRDG